MWVQKPREDHMLEKKDRERGERWIKKLDQKTRCSLWCCLVLVDSIPNSYSNGVVFISALLDVLVSVLLIFSSRWVVMRKTLVNIEWSKVCCLNEWEKHKQDWMLCLVPQDASWRRPPPSIAVSSLVKEGIKRKQGGKVIFFSCLSILLVGFFHFYCVLS